MHCIYSIKLVSAYHQIELNEGIKIICFVCHFNVYFSRNWRKCLQNDERRKFKDTYIYLSIYGADDIISSCRT